MSSIHCRCLKALLWGTFFVAVTETGCATKDPEVLSRLRSEYPNCSPPKQCGDLYFVDCDSAADGPSYYFSRRGDRISSCGGACWHPPTPEQKRACETLCPPPTWSCP